MGQLWSSNEPQPGRLLQAIRQNNVNEVFNLLDAGVSVNEVHENCTPLYAACQRGYLSVVQALLLQGADINKGRLSDKDTPVHAAVRSNQLSVLQELLQMEADINSANNSGETPLTLAVGTGNETLLNNLLAAGSNPAKRNRSKHFSLPLHEAIQKQDFAMTKVLCSKPGLTNVQDSCGRSAMHIAVQEGKLDFVRLLLNHHCDVNIADENDVTPLHTASALGFMDIARVLLQSGGHVNAMRQGWGREGFSPLHEAAYAGHQALCRLLCECGADKNLRDFYGKGALHLACESGHTAASSILLRYGCDPAMQDLAGCTPLIYASREGALELVQNIITRNCNLDSVGPSKRTALHFAAKNGFELIVKLLLEAGAQYHIKDQCMWSPLDHAMAGSHIWCMFYLIQHGHPLPPQDTVINSLNSMIVDNLTALALLLQLGWRPSSSQLEVIRLTLSRMPADLSDIEMDIRALINWELNTPCNLLRLTSNAVVHMLAQRTGYRSIMDSVLELEIPTDVMNTLCLVELQQFMFLVE